MQVLPDNYKRNIDILKINLNRGMTAKQANAAISNMVKEFTLANMYNSPEQLYIDQMYATVIEYFTKISVAVIK
jgi:hypothetical protein